MMNESRCIAGKGLFQTKKNTPNKYIIKDKVKSLTYHRLVATRVQNVQLINFSSDAVHFAVKVLDGWCVRVVEFIIQKPE